MDTFLVLFPKFPITLATTAGPTTTTVPQTGTTTGTVTPGLGVVPVTTTATPDLPVFTCPRRPNLGREGRPILLRANHFQISMPRGFVHHYDINIQPDKCPRKVCTFEVLHLSGKTKLFFIPG